jgi:hypothetical protein
LFGFHPDLDVDAGGEGMFCLPKYGLKFKTFNGGVFMFKVDRILHCTIKCHRCPIWHNIISEKIKLNT